MSERLVADRYRLVEIIGSGGMGVVWDAWDERLQRRVALKQLRSLPGLTEDETRVADARAMREARITARLHHRHAVSVFDVVDDDGRPCLVMQFVPSTTLAELVRERGPLPAAEVAGIGARVASALAAAHDLGIVHRDVKPGNVLIGDDGPMISDFGISRALDDVSLTSTGLVHGTPAYLSPEGARGEQATYASDVFCLGSTLYTALEGSPPFGSQGNSIAMLHRVAAGTVQPPQHGGTLTPLLARMMARDADERPSMAEVAAELEVLGRETAGTAQVRAAPPVPVQPEPQPAGRPPDTFRFDPAPLAAAPTPPETVEPERPPRRRGGLVALVAALVTIVVLAAVLLPRLVGPGGGPAAGPADTSSVPSASTEPTSDTAPPEDSGSAPPADEDSSEDEQTDEAPSPAPTSPSPSGDSDGSAGEDELTAAVTDYYALMPDDTDEAWPRMTSGYQNDHAGGRDAYEDFWDEVDRVETSDVTASPPDEARATLTYYYDDGRVLVEPTAFELVQEEGRLKIAASTVLSNG